MEHQKLVMLVIFFCFAGLFLLMIIETRLDDRKKARKAEHEKRQAEQEEKR